MSQLGALPEQSLEDAHCTHALVAGSHAGVAPEHSLAEAHCSHLPALGPLETQTPAWHWASDAQVPCPMPRPHTSPSGSQTPDAQARAPRVASHAPPGMAAPLSVFGSQVAVPAPPRSSHHCPLPQSASAVQRVVPQEPPTQYGAAASHAEGVPEPESPSQATHVPLPVSHTRPAHWLVALHGTQLLLTVSQTRPEQSAFDRQIAHEPVEGLHKGAPAGQAYAPPPPKSVSQATQVPAIAPEVTQYGALSFGQAAAEPPPKFPSQAGMQTLLAGPMSQPLPAGQSVAAVLTVHSPQTWVVVSQTAPYALLAQSASLSQQASFAALPLSEALKLRIRWSDVSVPDAPVMPSQTLGPTSVARSML